MSELRLTWLVGVMAGAMEGTEWRRHVLVLWEKVKIQSLCEGRRGTGPFPGSWANRADQLIIPKCTTLNGEVTSGCGSWCVRFRLRATDWKVRSTLVRGGGWGVCGALSGLGVFVGRLSWGVAPGYHIWAPLGHLCESAGRRFGGVVVLVFPF